MVWQLKPSRLDAPIRVSAFWLWNVLFLPERINQWCWTHTKEEAGDRIIVLYASTLLDVQMSVSVLFVRARLTTECVTETNREIWNEMRIKRSVIFHTWVAQYVRSLFPMYYGTKDITNITIMIQHIYYYVKYQLYDHLTDFVPIVQSNVISCPR